MTSDEILDLYVKGKGLQTRLGLPDVTPEKKYNRAKKKVLLVKTKTGV